MSQQSTIALHHNALLAWDHSTCAHLSGWYVGSAADDGSHQRGDSGWPYSIYRRAVPPGASDMVLCEGIQDWSDAELLAALLNDRVAARRDPPAPPSLQPVAVFRQFATRQDARTFRREHGTGGWIFDSTDDGPHLVVLFPPSMAPSAIFNHPMVKGRNGDLIGNG